MDQPVFGAVRREFVEGDVEAGAIHRVPANVFRELNATPKPRKIVLDTAVLTRETTLREQYQIGQKQPDEYVEHVEVVELGDAGLVELSGAEAAVGP